MVATRLKTGEKQAMVMQDYQTLGRLLSEAFGSGGGEPEDQTPKTMAQAEAQLKAVLGR